MMVSINEEKYFSRVHVCIKARSVELFLLAANCKFSFPNQKTERRSPQQSM